ncbi:hypothetical protein AB0F81_46480 [Actinoplanes sp. NPDC024001]|uniref:hypothetical protein n=1 Tax=Actinoplanes sp. NPDC024001 TaxID=3154598 RepID=UPI003403AEF1
MTGARRTPLSPAAPPGGAAGEEITVFDSSGIALQDLFIADALLGLAGEPR